MTRDVLIGIDAGTSVIKAVAFDSAGIQIAAVSRRNNYTVLPNGGVEQDMRRTWTDTAAALSELVESREDLACRVLSLAVTGQGDGTWLVDSHGEPVHDGWLWLDARSVREARELSASKEIDAIYRRTASGINICQMRTHFLWMKRHEPGLLERAATAFHCKEWLYFNLTGERAADPTEAVFTFGDYRTRQYSDKVLEALGCADLKRLLPPIVDGASQSHELLPEIAEATGLPSGLPVSLGCVDVACSAMGAGLYDETARPGVSVLGSTGMHMRFVPDAESVVLNEHRTGYTMALPGKALSQMQTNMAATLNIDWFIDLARDVLGCENIQRSRSELLSLLEGNVLKARPGAAMFHPYISKAGERGPFTEPDARASFTGLDQSTTWFEMARAVYDSLVLASRDCYEHMGPTPPEIRVVGGAARSAALRLMLASALRSPVRAIAQEEAGAVGAVMIAAVCQGLFSDISEATESWIKPLMEAPVAPDPDLADAYDELFKAYSATRDAMRPAWSAQAEMRSALT